MLPDELIDWLYAGTVVVALVCIGAAFWREYHARRAIEGRSHVR